MVIGKRAREVFFFAFTQMVLYGLIAVNVKGLSTANVPMSVCSDILIASFNFWVVRRIAKTDESLAGWIGYVAGGAIGTVLGIRIGRLL